MSTIPLAGPRLGLLLALLVSAAATAQPAVPLTADYAVPGTARYDAIPGLGIPETIEDVSLEGDDFFTLGFLVGASYLLREDLTLDFGAFYEFMLDPTEDTIELQPFPNSPPLDGVSTFDGELVESGLYLSVGLSFVF